MSGLAAFDAGEPELDVAPHWAPLTFDFDFVQFGRLQIENRYTGGRKAVNRWLAQRGKQRLIALRAAFVRQRYEEAKRLSRKDMGRILAQAVPMPDVRVSPILASRAARFLRQVRNGGWIISPTNDGLWWVGSRRRTAAELVELARSKGFQAIEGEDE